MEPSISSAESVLSEARRWRPEESSVALEPMNPQQGRSHWIYRVTFSDSSPIVARVAKEPGGEQLERRAVDVLNHIKRCRPNCQVPRVHWHNLGQPHHTGPIVFEELVLGRALSVWNCTLTLKSRRAFLDSLATFLLDLWSISAPCSLITSQPVTTYSDWLQNGINKAIRRCASRSAKWGRTIDYLVMRTMVPNIARDVDIFTTKGIAHGDMNTHNFIVNEQMDLQGVIDWDWTFIAPLPAVVQFPWFMADVPGWHNDGVGDAENFDADRAYLVEALEVRENSQNLGNTLSGLLSNAHGRQRFQSAINYRDIHAEFVRSLPKCSPEALQVTMAQFLMKHPNLHDSFDMRKIRSPDLEKFGE